MNNLEKRLEALEAALTGGRETLTWVVTFLVPGKPLGELVGVKTSGGYVKRKARESEEALLERAIALAEPYRAAGCAISVVEHRGG